MSSPASVSAAHRVLSDPQFFGLLTPWMSGWPGRVIQRWQAFKSSRPTREPTDDMAFTKMLVEQDDRRSLQLVLTAVWRDPFGDLQRFRFSLNDAIATANAAAVRRTLDSNEWIRRNVTAWTWLTAVAYFRGDPAILNLLKSYAMPAWTENRVRSQLFRKDIRLLATQLFQAVDLACVQWFVDTFGASCLPSHVVHRLDDRLARFLSTRPKSTPQASQQRPPIEKLVAM